MSSEIKALIKPKALAKGQTIGLVAPSFALPKPELLPLAVTGLEAMGYRVKVSDGCTARHGCFAGPDAMRAAELNAMFHDDAVDAILCVRGGYGATRLLRLLDYDVIRSNPKIFSGYSDVTALHGAIQRHAGLVTFHGPMAVSDLAGEASDSFGADAFFRMVSCQAPAGRLDNPPGYPRRALSPGCATGRLVGGNLSLISASLGTPDAFDFDGALLFLEDVDEKTYAVDRLLTHLRRAGVFDRCAGVLLGDFSNCEKRRPDDFSLPEVLLDAFAGFGKPVLAGIRCGHCDPKMTLPLGILCRMDADAGTLEALEGAVADG